MAETSETLITCEDRHFAGPGRRRVVIDLAAATVTFENCHWRRSFLSFGCESIRVCQLDEIAAAHDFLSGKHRDHGIRTVLTLGYLTGNSPSADQLASIFISTAHGRCRVFADWAGFEDFRDTIQHICERTSGGHWSDDPRLIPLYVLAIFAIVGGLLWWLL